MRSQDVAPGLTTVHIEVHCLLFLSWLFAVQDEYTGCSMTEKSLNRIDIVLDAVRDRPGLALALAAGSGLVIGAAAGGYILSKRQAEVAPAAKVLFAATTQSLHTLLILQQAWPCTSAVCNIFACSHKNEC